MISSRQVKQENGNVNQHQQGSLDANRLHTFMPNVGMLVRIGTNQYPGTYASGSQL